MAVSAAQTQYRDEFVAVFEQGVSILRSCCVTEAVVKGNTATFLVAGSGSATAVTRGVNGLIPARNDSLTQTSATLAEWHDLVQKSGFNIFESQGDQRRIMQETSVKVLNRKIDLDIIAQLDTATIDTGTTATASVAMVAKSLAALGNAYVDISDTENMFGVVTPAFWSYIMQTKEFAEGNYVDVKMFTGPVRKMFRWFGVNWMIHPLLTGVTTSTELCYVFHRNAIGNAFDAKGADIDMGYNGEQQYSWARSSGFFGSALLQNTGVVQMKHDGSATALS